MTNERLIDLIIENMKSNKVDFEKQIDLLTSRINSIDSKVDSLLEFKWKLLGVATASSAIVAVMFHFAEVLMKK
jgi:hypothetical protein